VLAHLGLHVVIEGAAEQDGAQAKERATEGGRIHRHLH